MARELTEELRPYGFHGVDLTHSSGNEWIGDCFVCEKENHLYINEINGMWSCKSCGESGNRYTFLKLFHERILTETTKEDYEKLSGLRSPISSRVLKRYKLAYDHSTRRWILPIHNHKGTVVNLRCWFKPSRTKPYMFLNTSSCSAQLFNSDKIKHNLVLMCEGEWDAIALDQLIKKLKIKASVIAVPGANVFKDAWTKSFKGKEIWLLFDKDSDKKSPTGKITNAGRDGMVRILKKWNAIGSKDRPKVAKVVNWEKLKESTLYKQHPVITEGDLVIPEKWDIRDMLTWADENAFELQDVYDLLEGLMVSSDLEAGEEAYEPPSIVRTTFSEVLEDFKANSHVDRHFEDALAICLATCISVRIPGDPIWLFLVGPPGCGKTLILDSFAAAKEQCECMSRFTDKTFVSGWKQGDDSSLLPQLKNRCLVVKDYTTIVSLPSGAQEQLYGILRDIYDGTYSTRYGNNEIRSYEDISFSFLAGVTDVIHRGDRVELGERFLKCELLGPDSDSRLQIRAAMEGSTLKLERAAALRESIHAYLVNDMDVSVMPSIPTWFEDRLVNLGQLVAYLRSSVARSRDRDLSYEPRVEIGSRPASQLKRLAICLCFVFDKDEADDNIYRLIYQVALNSSKGYQQNTIKFLYMRKAGCVTSALSKRVKVSDSQVKRITEDLLELGMVDFDMVPNGSGNRGRDTKKWYLTSIMRELWKQSKPRSKGYVKGSTASGDTDKGVRSNGKPVSSHSVNRKRRVRH